MMDEWKNEPNEKKFKSSGYECIIKRHTGLLHLCGYVDIPKGHALHSKGYNELYEMGIDIDVHGGLTYAEPEGDNWRFGFDCAHAGDLVPSSYNYGIFDSHETYKNIGYVEAETRKLAKQLKTLA